MIGTISGAVSGLGRRFSFAGVLPFALVAGYMTALYVIAATPPHHGVLEAVNSAARHAGPVGLALLFTASVVLAVITEPFQIAIVRFLEGYWGAARGTKTIRNMAVEHQRRKRIRLKEAAYDAANREQDAARNYALRSRVATYPKNDDHLLPTRLGNALRAGETQSGERYGLDTILVWPRIFGRASEDLRLAVSELHEQIDAGARLTVALLIAGIASAPVLLQRGWWNLVTLGTILAACVAYLGAVNAAARLNVLLETIFDLYRFDLLSAMHLPLPATHHREMRINERLSEFLAGNQPSPLSNGQHYRHPQ